MQTDLYYNNFNYGFVRKTKSGLYRAYSAGIGSGPYPNLCEAIRRAKLRYLRSIK